MRSYCLKVWGDYACFTRPEMKVERVSYDVMTPSAARAVFEAVFWKPAITWRIERIEVLNPIRWATLRRNEVGGKVPVRSVETAMRRGKGALGLFIEEDRQQRAGLFLRDVAYRIHAHFEMNGREPEGNGGAKVMDMFERRAARGQCFMQPYLGCREFSAYFEFLPEFSGESPPIGVTRDLGWMLYDLDFEGEDPSPRFFKAHLEDGVLDVPPWDSPEVKP